MKIREWFLCILLLLIVFTLTNAQSIMAKESKQNDELKIPNNIISLSKANTFPNPMVESEVIEPSALTEKLLSESKLRLDNPQLIKLLNESLIKPSPLAIGYKAEIYLGRWPLNYESQSTSVIWDYQLINENNLNNRPGDVIQELRYVQQEEREVKGALTNKISEPDMIKTMMLQSLAKKTTLPLSFSTKVGVNTKLNNFYHVPPKKAGVLHAYIPAMNEKGQVTSGEVYIQLKGKNVVLVIKNVTKQGIGAWIPIQDHVALSFSLK